MERKVCNACGGTRFTNAAGGRIRCWKCDGNGYLTHLTQPCNRCHGNGKILLSGTGNTIACPTCDGSGETIVT